MPQVAPVQFQEGQPVRACLRIGVDSAARARSEALEALVSKLVSAFLESRWSWPRHFDKLTPVAFLLTDPRSGHLDLNELKHLARELQSKLFGVEGAGGVDLLVFQGDEMALHRFARLSQKDLASLVSGRPAPELEGELSRIEPEGVIRLEPASAGVAGTDSPAPLTPDAGSEPLLETCYRGVYLAPRQTFANSLVLQKPFGSTSTRGSLDRTEVIAGITAETYDRAGIEALRLAVQAPAIGNLIVPLCFSSLVRPAARAVYGEWLASLPPETKDRRSVTIYDTPRNPSFYTLSQIVRFLEPHFGRISLNVADPDFDSEHLPPSVGLVIYSLQGAETKARLAGLRRFAEHLPAFKRKRIWPGIENVKNRAELDASLARGMPIVSGPAVCELLTAPANGRVMPLSALPLRA